ncbi:hypothetical protein VNO78_36381 [Psophocarpus tetragonolobus]|uniref:Uncharacterized protein n=1 Tax=Psophocarpus tetragonolobus TaxID=3891 RepID=A0AAN9RHG8_PSOTE
MELFLPKTGDLLLILGVSSQALKPLLSFMDGIFEEAQLEGPPSSQVIRYRKYCRRVSHASCFSESVPSVSQSRFAIKRGKSLDFRLGRSRHSCNSPVHRSREHPNRCRVPLFPVRESPSALTGRARILMSVIRAVGGPFESCGSLPLHEWGQSSKRFGFSVGSRSPAPPHSPLVGRVVNLEGARLLFRRVFDNLAVVRSPLLEAGVLGRWGFLFLNQFGCVSPEIGWSNIYELAGQRWMEVPCCSPLPEAKDGVEPSFQDLQSDTFPLCYPAKPATSCAKVKRLFFLPRSLFFYICGRSTLYDRRRVTREEGTTSFSLALLHFPFLIESRKPLHYWYRGQKVASSICSGKEHLEASFCLKVAHPAQRIHCSKISLSPLLPVSILVDSLLPSRKRLVRPFCVAFFVILRFSLRFSDSRDPTLISYFNVSSMFWAAHLVSSAITAGSPCGCSAAIGRLRADRCLPGGIGAPEGGLRSLLSLRPSIPFKRDPALRLVTLFAHLLKDSLAPRSIRSEPGLRTFSHRFLSPSHRQQSALIPWCGVKGRVPFLSCPKTGFILIGERLSRGKVLHIGPAALSRLPLVRLAPFFRLGSVPGLRPLGFYFSRRQSTCQPFLSH